MSDEKPMGQVIQIDEARIRDHLGELVRGTVEETLNAMLDAEADQLCGAGRYERSQARQDTRAGSYERTLQTSAGEVNLKVPKLRRQTFETAIIDRYRRRESSVEEALIEMYLAGISVRRVEDITEALWGTRVSPSTVSNLNKKIYAKIEAWRNRRIEGEHPYLYLDGIVMKRTWGRRGPQRLAACGQRRQFRRFSRNSGHLRRRQGGQVRLVSIPAPPGRSRPQWRATHHLRCLPRSDGKRRRVSARRSVAALHGSFLSEHLQPCAGHQGPRSESHAQSHPFPGEPQRSRPQGPRDRRRPAGRPDEHRGRSGRAQRPRDADLLRFSRHPLAQDPHQQPARTDHARDPSTNSCCRCIPRWPVVPQPRRRTIALHREDRMVRQMLHEHAAALSAAGRANRSRRLIKCAKDCGHFQRPRVASREATP